MAERRAGVDRYGGFGLDPEELGALIEHLPLPVGFTDSDGTARYLNQAARERYGLTDEALGRDAVAQVVAPSDTATALEIVESVLAGRAWYGSFPVTPPNGGRFIGRFLAAPAVAPELGLAGVLSVELVGLHGELDGASREAEAALLAQAEQANLLLEGVLSSAPVALAVFDRSLRFVRANPAAAAMTGLPVHAHIGRRLPDVITRVPPTVVDHIASVFATGEAVVGREVEGEAPGAPGERRHWLVSYYPVHRRGEVLWVGTVALDITDRKRAEAERARLLAAEHEARTAAEEMAARLADLQSITAGLAAARTREDVAEVVFAATAGLGAAGRALCLVGDGGEVEVVASAGFHPTAVERFQRFSLDDDLPAPDSLRTGRLVVIDSVGERDRRYPRLAGVPSANQSFAVVPLLAHQAPLGCITIGWAERRELSDDDRGFLVAIGQQAAQALERVHFTEAERATARRQAFLAEASRVLASSFEDDEALARVAALAVGELADACSVHLLEDDRLRRVATAGADADAEELAARLVPAAWSPGATGTEELVPASTPLLEVRPAGSGVAPPLLASLRATSVAVVPMRSGERPVGVLALATT
ncbi:MAG: PAS domain-containing protein, partial [Actinomycetota bacterium]|nr:PAS domain-containing protein [Actinomycetota bacterium]